MSNADDVKELAALCAGRLQGLALMPAPLAIDYDREEVRAKSVERSFPATIPTSPRKRTAALKIFTPNNLSIVLFLEASFMPSRSR
jgi:hypothetical protein